MTVTTDGFLPAAVNAGLLADSLLAAETLEEGRADAMAPAESISMTPGNATEPAAFRQRQSAVAASHSKAWVLPVFWATSSRCLRC